MRDFEALQCTARRAGFRLTRQRQVILHALCALDGHASAERVHARLAGDHPPIHLSTVYRTLEKLRDLGILSQIDLGRQCVEFEIVGEHPHHHLVCRACGSVTDLDHRYLAVLDEPLRRDFGFEPVLCHFAIFGLCRHCRESIQDEEEGKT
ncbi:MAG TPA: transcriptional repressor [Anaerolineae bacterium]|nr:transcriptional repressor [Anaerolineae bacterium]